jgi:hypothetical protein
LIPQERKLLHAEQFAALSSDLKHLYASTFPDAYLWNSLHINEFSIGEFLQLSVTKMVSAMFNGGSDVNGFVTSGGTISCLRVDDPSTDYKIVRECFYYSPLRPGYVLLFISKLSSLVCF